MQHFQIDSRPVQLVGDAFGSGRPRRHRLERCEVEGGVLRVEGSAHRHGATLSGLVLSYEASTYVDRVKAVPGLPHGGLADRDDATGFTTAGLVVREPGTLFLDWRGDDGETCRERLGMFDAHPATGAPTWSPAGAAAVPRDGAGPAWQLGPTFEQLPASRHAGRALLSFGSPPQITPARRPVSILVSIGPGPCPATLFGNLRDTNGCDEIILVDAFAGDGARSQRIAVEAARIPRCRLVTQPMHQGAIRGISAAFAARAFRGHVVVLDSDTELPPGWLGRLIWPLDNLPGVASATPFSDARMQCSLGPAVGNAALHSLDVTTIDRAFQAIDARRLVVPLAAGDGPCMALHADALASIGFYDGAAFGFGPGEEIDWCLRARAKGWRDLLVPNLFVHRRPADARPAELIRHNLERVHQLHPGYVGALAEERRSDPTAALRAIIGFRLARQASGLPVRMVTVDAGDRFGRVAADLASGEPLVVVLFDADRRTWSALLAIGGYRDQVWGTGLTELRALRTATGAALAEMSCGVAEAPAPV